MKIYGLVGAIFIPMLALALICLNGRGQLIGRSNRNSVTTTLLLSLCLLFFAAVLVIQLGKLMGVDVLQLILGDAG